ncbi:unnamed protein product [Adineta steineri]|uniref:Proteasomal ubiquitin receptor ADRM1-like protein n=1 Tax=Adineta steineri TaxID=433720 RepID=A0A818L8H1_9BILA|nr:unnamed protein product [Adineta steineri]CAF1326129.1 unnamed protein product [Adineta steineri]CAF1373309.1 unnamed protein product [Adineta steineri]CAF1535726.1 unnamed protein product [Adineta steineri]CAF1536025.1 unnamed protein product [Adineta steineri]
MSLFGGAASQARSRNLVEFKAGKMNLRGTMVHPDKRKGLVYLYQGNDMLMHFCWKERSSSTAEDDLVIFPDEIEFKKVTQNTTGRVYILKWRSNARKLFFWMQEPKEDKDEEWCKKINDLLNSPPTPGFGDDSSGAGGLGGGAHPLQSLMDRMTGGSGAGGIDPNDLSNVLRGMNPNDLASLLSSVGSGGGAPGLMQGSQRGRVLPGSSTQPSTSLLDAFAQQTPDSRPNTAPAGTRATGTAAPTATASAGTTSASSTRPSGSSSSSSSSKPRNGGTSSSPSTVVPTSGTSSGAAGGPKGGPIQMSALSNILANLSSGTTTQGAGGAGSDKPAIDLYDIMSSEHLIPILSNKEVQETLRAHLPDGNVVSGSEKELRESVQSPQFRQAVSTFSVALQTGQLGPVLAQFGLPEEAITAANEGDMQAFAQAMEKHYKKSNEETDEKKSSDNTMDTN